MEIMRKYNIERTSFPIDGVYNYNAQVYASVDGGSNFYYCGIGRFCKTSEEAAAWCEEYEAKHAK